MKLSLHCMAHKDVDSIIDICNKWQAPVVKFLDNAAELGSVLRGVDHPMLGVLRLWREGLFHSNNFDPLRERCTVNGHFNAELAADLWLEGVNLNPLKGLNVAVESYNEVGISKEYLMFEAARCRALKYMGFKACVINSGVGWTLDWKLAKEAGLLDTLRETGSVIGTHGYAGLVIDLWHNVNHSPDRATFLEQHRTRKIYSPAEIGTWLTFRVARYHSELAALGYGDLKHVITEFGFDNAGDTLYKNFTNGESKNSWRSWIPTWQNLGFVGDHKSAEEFVADEYFYADQQFSQYPFLIGATVWTFGSDAGSTWRDFDIKDTAIVPLLSARLGGVMPPKPTGVTITPKAGAVNIRHYPLAEYKENIIGLMQPHTAYKVVAKREGDSGLWYKHAGGGYSAASVVTVSGGDVPFEVVPKETLKAELLDMLLHVSGASDTLLLMRKDIEAL